MLDLNLPKYDFKVKIENGKKQIFDSVRKRFVVLTPEEWVRQHFIQFLHRQKDSLELDVCRILFTIQRNAKKRADIICFKTDGKPFFIGRV